MYLFIYQVVHGVGESYYGLLGTALLGDSLWVNINLYLYSFNVFIYISSCPWCWWILLWVIRHGAAGWLANQWPGQESRKSNNKQNQMNCLSNKKQTKNYSKTSWPATVRNQCCFSLFCPKRPPTPPSPPWPLYPDFTENLLYWIGNVLNYGNTINYNLVQ